MKKIILLLIIALILITTVMAQDNLEECMREQKVRDIPCFLVTADAPENPCITHESLIFSENGTFLGNQGFQVIGESGRCRVTFNFTTSGQYYINSSIDTWNVLVVREDNMLAISIIQIFLISFFILVGLPYKFGFAKFTAWSLALLEIVITIWIIYLYEAGQNITIYLYVNAVIVLVFGGTLGFIAILMLMAKMTMGEQKPIKDDSYTKFIFDNK